MASKVYTAEGFRMHAGYLRREHHDEVGAAMLEQAADALEREEKRNAFLRELGNMLGFKSACPAGEEVAK